MKMTNRAQEPAFARLATLPPKAGGRMNEHEEGLVGHLDDDGEVITPPNMVTLPVS